MELTYDNLVKIFAIAAKERGDYFAPFDDDARFDGVISRECVERFIVEHDKT